MSRPAYPDSRRSDVAGTYHGVHVADPYRWLEDADAPETQAWVAAQNELTRSFLDGPVRDALVHQLTALYNYPRTGVPFKRGNRYFFAHNTGLQEQPVLYVQDALATTPRILLDPGSLRGARGGPVALTAMIPDDSGALLAYALSESGSDRQELSVRDVSTGRDLPDRLQHVKFVSLAWTRTGDGFFYTRFPGPGTVPPGDENYFNKVYYHRLGDAQDSDVLIIERPAERETVFGVETSDDGRWAVITAYRGSSNKSEVHLLDLSDPGATPVPVFRGYIAAYSFIEYAGGRLLFSTDEGAPLGRIVSVDPGAVSAEVREVVPQRQHKLSAAVVVHDTLVVSYLQNASDRIVLFDLSGTPAGTVDLPSIGSLTGLTGRPGDAEMFVGFTSFTYPSASFRYDFKTRTL